MPNRKRPIIMRLAVTEEEKKLIEEKMKILGARNFGAYARKMLIDGYIIKVDYSEQRKHFRLYLPNQLYPYYSQH